MLLLTVALWFILTIPVGIMVGRILAHRRSPEPLSQSNPAQMERPRIARQLDRSA